jgi:AcrR family transcriptional regulator
MTDASQPSPGRSRGRPALPIDRIVAAAVELLDEQGAEALSMRSLAQRLESGTATLYRHYSNRSELVSAVIDHILGEVDFDAQSIAGLTWQQACTSHAQHMFDALSRHGNVASLLIDYTPMGPNALVNRELCLTVLLDNGFPPAVAATHTPHWPVMCSASRSNWLGRLRSAGNRTPNYRPLFTSSTRLAIPQPSPSRTISPSRWRRSSNSGCSSSLPGSRNYLLEASPHAELAHVVDHGVHRSF